MNEVLLAAELSAITPRRVRPATPGMVDDADIVTHAEPALRDRTNFIERLDLASHGLPGRWEQMWLRIDDGQETFEMCCIPFFTDGLSLGDKIRIDPGSGGHVVIAKSGKRTIRYAFQDQRAAYEQHDPTPWRTRRFRMPG